VAGQPEEEVRKQEARARNKKNEKRGLIPSLITKYTTSI